MPWACQTAFRRQYALDQWRSVVRAVRAGGMNLILDLQQEHLSPLNTLNFGFFLLSILHLQGGDILELELLRHRCG